MSSMDRWWGKHEVPLPGAASPPATVKPVALRKALAEQPRPKSFGRGRLALGMMRQQQGEAVALLRGFIQSLP
jgi:hypothetical protein